MRVAFNLPGTTSSEGISLSEQYFPMKHMKLSLRSVIDDDSYVAHFYLPFKSLPTLTHLQFSQCILNGFC